MKYSGGGGSRQIFGHHSKFQGTQDYIRRPYIYRRARGDGSAGKGPYYQADDLSSIPGRELTPLYSLLISMLQPHKVNTQERKSLVTFKEVT